MASTQSHVYVGAARSLGGTLGGIFRQAVGDKEWRHLTNGLPAEADVHAVTVHPQDADIVYIGTTNGVFRSGDGGEHWRRLPDPDLPADRVIMNFACRVMRLAVDPEYPDEIYATLEANGAMRSRDGGESWEDCTADLIRFCEDPRYRSRIGSQT